MIIVVLAIMKYYHVPLDSKYYVNIAYNMSYLTDLAKAVLVFFKQINFYYSFQKNDYEFFFFCLMKNGYD